MIFIIKIYSRRTSYETKTKEIRKKAARLLAYAGDDRRADAGDGADGVCGGSTLCKLKKHNKCNKL